MKIAATSAVILFTLPSASAQYQLFWQDAASSQEFRTANLDGSNSQALFTAYDLAVEHGGVPGVYDMAVDPVDGKLYWTEAYNSGRIQRSNLDGSNIEDVIPLDGPGIRSLALDLVARKIYWSSDGIYRANLDGSDIESVVNAADAETPQGLAGYFGGFTIFWACDSGIKSANLDGGQVQLIVPSNGNSHALEVDPHGQRVYWTELDTEQIRSARFDGTDVETLVTTSGYVTGVTVGDDGQSVYWSQPSGPIADHGIWRCAIDGTNPEQTVSGGAPWTLTLYTSHVHPALPAMRGYPVFVCCVSVLLLAVACISRTTNPCS